MTVIVKKRGRVYHNGVADPVSRPPTSGMVMAIELDRARAAILREIADTFVRRGEECRRARVRSINRKRKLLLGVTEAAYGLCVARLRERANELDGGAGQMVTRRKP